MSTSLRTRGKSSLGSPLGSHEDYEQEEDASGVASLKNIAIREDGSAGWSQALCDAMITYHIQPHVRPTMAPHNQMDITTGDAVEGLSRIPCRRHEGLGLDRTICAINR